MTSKYLGDKDEMMQSSSKSYQRGSGNVRVANCIILYKSLSLSRQKKQIGNCPVEEAKKMRCYKRLIYKQFVKVSCLNCAPQFLSYLPKHFVHLCRALYGGAILVYHFGPPVWPPEINKNIWSSLFL